MASKILLIDDDKFIRTVYQNKLADAGFEVAVAENAAKGLEMLASEKPNLILLDIMMEGGDGFSVLEQIPKNQSIPVVVFSGLSQESDKERAKSLGAVAFLPKDEYQPNQIIEEIKKLLA
jgi:CheY-like chemotaxis protein